MKKIVTFLSATFFLLVFLSGTTIAQPYCQWAIGAGGAQLDKGKSIAIDASGNVYTVGYYTSATISFGTKTLTNSDSYGYGDIFIVKQDSCGNVVWAKTFGNSGSDDRGLAVTTDKAGNIYAAGIYNASAISFGTYNATNSGGGFNSFLTKLNPSGTVMWATSSDGNYSAYPTSLKCDKNNNIYMAGYYNSDSLKFGSVKLLLDGGYYNMFLVKYDSNGSAIWGKGAGSQNYGDDEASAVCVDTTGNVFVAGAFQDSLNLGSIKLRGLASYNVFLAKYNSTGTLLWANSAGKSSDCEAYGVATDKSGNAYLSGYFGSDTITFGSYKLANLAWNGNGFLCKYNSAGTVQWAKRIGGAYDDAARKVSVDGAGNILVCGNFMSSQLFIDNFTLLNSASTGDTTTDIFIAKYNSSGKAIWARAAGSPRADFVEDMALSPNGIATITGEFTSTTLTFGATTINDHASDYDVFITNDLQRTGMTVPDLCAVTVDSLSKNNVIYWDKTPYNTAKNFIVYRETSSNIYKPLGVIPYDSLSYFTDTVRTKYFPNTGDPNIGTYRYKLQYMDSSGVYSLMSLFHNTIYVANNAGTFSWNPYLIEPSTNPVTNYVLMRDDLGSGIWSAVGNVAGTQTTLSDPSYTSFLKGRWRVETQWPISCTAAFIQKPVTKGGDMSVMAKTTVNNSRSNIKNNLSAGINEFNANALVSIYPNPTADNLNIEWTLPEQPTVIIVRNYLGMEVMKFIPEKNQNKTSFNVSGLTAGIYSIEIKGEKYTALKRLVLEK